MPYWTPMGWLKRLFRRTDRPCHVAYPATDNPRLTQGMAICMRCGKMHLTKPRLSEAAIDDVLGGR